MWWLSTVYVYMFVFPTAVCGSLTTIHRAPCPYTVYNSKRYAVPDRGKELQPGWLAAWLGPVRVDTRDVVSLVKGGMCEARGGNAPPPTLTRLITTVTVSGRKGAHAAVSRTSLHL